MRERHWASLSTHLGYSIRPTMELTLLQLIEKGFLSHVDYLSELSGMATKEHSLEKQLEGMIMEWEKINLELLQYKDKETYVLKGTDKLLEILDDHIIKTQAMKGSAFVKPFESRIQAWEEKLNSMQQMLSEWLTLQTTFLYLKPVFASDDIMQQMPTEARR